MEGLGRVLDRERQVHAVVDRIRHSGLRSLDDPVNGLEELEKLLDRTLTWLGFIRQRFVQSSEEEPGLVKALAQRTFREGAKLLAKGCKHVFRRRQYMLCLCCGVRQIVSLDFVEVRKREDELTRVTSGNNFAHSSEGCSLHRL